MTEYRPFMLRRTTGGDVLRPADVPEAWQAALRYGPRVVLPEEVENTSLETAPLGYESALITVRVPEEVAWTQAVLVRGGFGFPTTPQDGVQVWYTNTKPIDIDMSYRTLDTPLTEGNWYYYSLFLWIGGQWVKSAEEDVLVPQNHHHSELLFNALPPFYQKTDDENAVDARNGALRLFTSVVGYDLDYTRTMADGVLNLYNVDRVPYRLLRYLGENLGFPYEATLGAARYRSIIEQLEDLNGLRGTAVGLQLLVTSATDYECAVSLGNNIMLTTDDSEFVGGGPYYPSDPEYSKTGVGLWDNLAVTTLLNSINNFANEGPPTASTAQFAKGANPAVTPPSGRGYLVIQSIASTSIVLSLGVHIVGEEPVYKGIPVEPGALYDFQIDVSRTASVPVSDVWLGIMWFNETGLQTGRIATDVRPAQPDNIDHTTWDQFNCQAFAPAIEPLLPTTPPAAADAYYAVPFVWWRTASPSALPFPANGHLLAGTMFSKVVSAGEAVQPISPDVLLTMGVAGKTIGEHPGGEYYMGDQP